MERLAPALAVELSDVAADLPAPMPFEGPEDLPGSAAAAAREALARGETHYTDRPGIGVLRSAVAARLTRGGFEVDADHVLVTCGIEEARFVILQAAMPRGGSVVAMGEPAVGAGVRAQRGKVVPLGRPADVVFLGDERVDPEALRSSRDDHGWLVLEAPDAELSAAGRNLADARTIVVGGLGARSGLLSLRVGFLACSAEAFRKLRDFKQALTICTTNLSQWAAHAWLESR